MLGLLALSFVPFAAWRSSVMQLTLRRTWLILQEKLGVLSRVMEENLAGIRVVRAFAAAPHEMAKFDAASADALALSHQRVNVRVRNTSPMTLAFFAAMGLVLLVGGRQVAAGEITVGTLATFLTFMTLLQMPVRQLGLMVNAYARGLDLRRAAVPPARHAGGDRRRGRRAGPDRHRRHACGSRT